jgi:murein DD-endopeptidase MepM/ murein hydrolase activator NlpD
LARATQHAAARRATSTSITDRLSRELRAFLRADANGARRALINDIRSDKRSWAQHGVAALAVSVLGLGVAGSVAMTGAAQPQQARITQPMVEVSVDPGVAKPSAFDNEIESTTDAKTRMALDPALINSMADQRTETLTRGIEQVTTVAKSRAVHAREVSLEKASEAARKQAVLIAAGRSTRSSSTRAATSSASTSDRADDRGRGNSCLPVSRGYTIAARFGQVGVWSRYHTGIDFSAPVGTPIRAPGSGVVINAGGGPASGWAGNYVAIRYPDGTQSLMAHMSTVSVSVGQTVAACQVVGAVGMTGRTFGPHLHFEIYPAGVKPGDVYRAINPDPWLRGRGMAP